MKNRRQFVKLKLRGKRRDYCLLRAWRRISATHTVINPVQRHLTSENKQNLAFSHGATYATSLLSS